MKHLLLSAALIFLSLILPGCDSNSSSGAGSPAESDYDTIKTGEQITESGIFNLAGGADTDENAEKHVTTEKETPLADPVLDERPEDPSKEKNHGGEVYISAGGNTDDKASANKDNSDSSEQPTEPPEEGSEPTGTDKGTNMALALDTTAGNWYVTPEKRLFSKETAAAAKNRIKALHTQIYTVKKLVKNGALSREEGREQTGILRSALAAQRDIIGSGGALQRGIHTFQANESLHLTVCDAEPGWYTITVVAKNLGPLPGGYHRFSMTLLNKSSETVAGNFSIKAREKAYSRGRLIFQLKEPGDRILDLLWDNDARDEKGDANIQIKDIRLKKIKKPRFTLRPVRRGREYSYLDGRWFFEKHNAYTYHANQTIGYTFYNLTDGSYEFIIKAKNRSKTGLPVNYEGFRIEINSDNNSDEIIIPASDKKWTRGKVALLFPEGDATVYLTWLNDTFSEGEHDTNLAIQMVSLRKTANSNMSAYLMKTTTGNRVIITGILLALILLISGISLANRKKAQFYEDKT